MATPTFEELLKTDPNKAFEMGKTLGGEELKKYVAPTTPIPPAGSGLEFLRYESPFEKETRARLESAEKNKLTPGQEQQIREQERAQVQSQIDAINSMFAGEFRKAEREGANRLGSITAIQARGGLIGSDFEVAQRAQGQEYNAEIRAGIQARQNLEIQKLYDKSTERADKAIEAKNTLAKTNADDYLKFLEGNKTEARTDVENYFKGGGTLDTLKKTEFKSLLEQAGYNEFQLNSLYLSNKPKGEILSKERVGNKFLVFTKKPDGTIETTSLDIPGISLGSNDDIEFVNGSALIVSYAGEKGKSKITGVKVAEGTTQGQFKDVSAPTSYKEWQLAGKPGTYASWVKDKGGTFGEPTASDKSSAVQFLRSKVGQEVDLGNGVTGVVSEDDVKRLETDNNFFASVLTNAKAAGY